ncbi:MAG: ATP-binding cassette domain-containing protein [Pseudomonadota bacterium]
MLDASPAATALADGAARLLPIRLRGICFADGGRQLLDSIDLDIAAGSRTVILGPNGSGKSLLLRIIDGLVAPTAGTITFAGAPPAPALYARQALVLQRPMLLRRSVADNIRFVLGHLGRAEQDDLIARLLSDAKLSGLERQPARLLSGGEQQRLALARARATAPLVLLLDEPTASLDPASAQGVEEIVRKAHEDDTKIILVTHDLALARRIADEVVFLHAGRIAEVARADAFFRSPLSKEARAYFEGRLLV